MSYRLGIDLGTSFLAAATAESGEPRILDLGSRASVLPSAVYVPVGQDPAVGEQAVDLGTVEPARLATDVPRRLGDPNPIVLAGQQITPVEATARLIRFAVDSAFRAERQLPDQVVVTHPSSWDPGRIPALRAALARAGIPGAQTCPAPVAAAMQFAATHDVIDGELVAICDFGAGQFDAAIVRANPHGFDLIATARSVAPFGGVDIDQLVLRYALSRQPPMDPADHDFARMMARLLRDCTAGKEVLSSQGEVGISSPLPGGGTVSLSRADFDGLIGPAVDATLQAVWAALRSSGTDLSAVRHAALLGGGSQIPAVRTRVGGQFIVPLADNVQLKYDVALGAARYAAMLPAAVVGGVLPAMAPTDQPPVLPAGTGAPSPGSAAPSSTTGGGVPGAGPSMGPPAGAPGGISGPAAAAGLAAGAGVAAGAGGGLGAGPASFGGAGSAVYTGPFAPGPADFGGGAPAGPGGSPGSPPFGFGDQPSGAPGAPGIDPNATTTSAKPVEPPGGEKKSKLGLLIGLIAAVVVLILGALAAIFVVLPRLEKPGPPGPSPTTTQPQSPSTPPNPPTVDLPASDPLTDDQLLVPRSVAADRETKIYLASVKGGDPIRLQNSKGTYHGPSLSPDRRTVIYINGNAGTLRTMAADGTGDRVLLKTPPKGCGAIRHLTWSPTNLDRLVVECRQESGSDKLLLIDLKGKVLRTLATGQGRIEDPTISPDGKLVAYWIGPVGGGNGGSIQTVALDGKSKPKKLTTSGAGVDADPAWSPDGSKIAFRRAVGKNFDVYLMTSAGKDVKPLVTGPARDEKPAWSPDGTQLLILSNRGADGKPGKTLDLFLVSADGSTAPQPLGLAATNLSTPTWSHR